MTKDERQQSLANARLACDYIGTVVLRQLYPEIQQKVVCLIEEFCRLDTKEQTQIAAGRKFGKLGAKHGKKGGWPKGKPRKGKK